MASYNSRNKLHVENKDGYIISHAKQNKWDGRETAFEKHWL